MLIPLINAYTSYAVFEEIDSLAEYSYSFHAEDAVLREYYESPRTTESEKQVLLSTHYLAKHVFEQEIIPIHSRMQEIKSCLKSGAIHPDDTLSERDFQLLNDLNELLESPRLRLALGVSVIFAQICGIGDDDEEEEITYESVEPEALRHYGSECLRNLNELRELSDAAECPEEAQLLRDIANSVDELYRTVVEPVSTLAEEVESSVLAGKMAWTDPLTQEDRELMLKFAHTLITPASVLWMTVPGFYE